MRVLIVAALIASVALAGCVAPTTGLSMQSAAEREATKMHEDAVLVGILGAEWTNESLADEVENSSSEAKALVEQGVDAQPGDGLANAWAYYFQSAEEDFVIVLAADKSVIDVQTVPGSGSEAGRFGFGFSHPIEEVALDSTDAAAIVNENHARFADVAAADDAIVMMFLTHDDEFLKSTLWMFMAFTQGEEDFVFAFVDANSGEYQDFSQFFGR